MDWELLYVEHQASMIHVAWLYLRNRAAAEDICHEVFVRLLLRRPVLEPGKERAFLMIAVANLCRDELNSARHRRDDSLDCADDDHLPGQHDCEALDRADLVRAVLRLRDDLRTSFLLHDYLGFTLTETARLLRQPQGTIAGRVRRARSQLQQDLKT